MDPKMKNQLLRRLSGAYLALLGPGVAEDHPARESLELAGEKPLHVYFIEGGVASVVAKVGRKSAEVGLVGSEGFVCSGLTAWDDYVVFDCMMQVGGSARRYNVDTVRAAMLRSPAVAMLLSRSVRSFAIQSGMTIWSSSNITLDARLARWLL